MIRWFLLSFLLFLTGCASTVSYDYDTTASFADRQSFSFLSPTQQATTLDSRRIRAAIIQELTNKGLIETTTDADLLIAYQVEDARRLESSGFSFGFGIGGSRSLFGISTAPPAREVKEGRLVVEIVDPARNEVIWRAMSRRNLSPDLTPAKRSARISEIVKEMFQNFPPADTR